MGCCCFFAGIGSLFSWFISVGHFLSWLCSVCGEPDTLCVACQPFASRLHPHTVWPWIDQPWVPLGAQGASVLPCNKVTFDFWLFACIAPHVPYCVGGMASSGGRTANSPTILCKLVANLSQMCFRHTQKRPLQLFTPQCGNLQVLFCTLL